MVTRFFGPSCRLRGRSEEVFERRAARSSGRRGLAEHTRRCTRYVEDNLFWVGNGFVAYFAELLLNVDGEFVPDNPKHFNTPFYSGLGQSGFGAPQFSRRSFEPPVSLQPASDGYWFVSARTWFYPSSVVPASPVNHIGAMLVSPSGQYSAMNDGNTLQFLAAHDGIFSVTAASQPQETCPTPLAWSGQEKLACVADVANASGGSHGEVRFFDLQSGGNLLTMSTLGGFCKDDVSNVDATSCTALQHGYGYGTNQAAGSPRGFSASGASFAFTRSVQNDAYLYWADLRADPPHWTGSLMLRENGASSRLAFSPDDEKLALQTGENLFIKTLSGATSDVSVSAELPPLDPCLEDFPTAPDRYCGNTERDAPFKWAPDSSALAYRNVDGTVSVIYTSHQADLPEFLLPLPICEKTLCSGVFEFQPSF